MACKVKKEDVSNFKVMEKRKQYLTAFKLHLKTLISDLKEFAI